MAATSCSDSSRVHTVSVLGAGVAGLQVAKQLEKAGIKCVLFEKADNFGGVWRENYSGFGLQVPKELYEFPAFPRESEEQDFIEAFSREREERLAARQLQQREHRKLSHQAARPHQQKLQLVSKQSASSQMRVQLKQTHGRMGFRKR